MIRGSLISLRLVREEDLSELFVLMSDIATRGDYFPTGLTSETSLRAQFARNGLWDSNEGMLLMVEPGGDIVGEIEFFPITSYLSGYELSYQLFGPQHAGKGYTTEAVRLLSDYLFDRLKTQRLQLNIHPDNDASKRIAQKCGYSFESLMRQCWYHRGEYHDLEIWARLRHGEGATEGLGLPRSS